MLAVIETDKAAMEMEAYDDGVLARILVREGESVPIGTPIAVIGGEGAPEAGAPSPVPASDHPEREVVPPAAPAPVSGVPAEVRAPASPLARKLARERGIDLSTLSGSGPSVRIVGEMTSCPVSVAALPYDAPMISIPAGAEPVVPMPERTPVAIRAAVARLDVAVLPRFETEWTAATAQARDEYSVMPVQHFTEKWWLWVAVRRWPGLAAQLRECERRAAAADDLADARAASAEIGEILRAAADAAA